MIVFLTSSPPPELSCVWQGCPVPYENTLCRLRVTFVCSGSLDVGRAAVGRGKPVSTFASEVRRGHVGRQSIKGTIAQSLRRVSLRQKLLFLISTSIGPSGSHSMRAPSQIPCLAYTEWRPKGEPSTSGGKITCFPLLIQQPFTEHLFRDQRV